MNSEDTAPHSDEILKECKNVEKFLIEKYSERIGKCGKNSSSSH